MIKISIKLFLLFALLANIGPLHAEEKLAQTGFQFLSVVPDARTASMAGAMTTLSENSSALWSNPATMAGFDKKYDVSFSLNNFIADINHSAFTFAYSPGKGQYGTFGISMLYVDYGVVEGTIFALNDQGFLEIGDINPNAYSVGLGYAKKLSNKFSVGAQIKLVHQNLGPAMTGLSTDEDGAQMESNKLSTVAYDFGTIYRTGLKSFVFGMSVRNFSEEIKYVDESFQLPLTFSIGASVDIFDVIPLAESQNLFLSTDAIHPRSHLEQVKVGLEYRYVEFISVRMGYITQADEQNICFGFGINSYGLGVDYAYSPYGLFNNVQQFTLRFSF